MAPVATRRAGAATGFFMNAYRGQSLISCLLALALMLVVGPFASEAQADELDQIRIGTAHRALFDIAADGDQLYAVGAIGTVLSSQDAGATWVTESSDSDLALLGVAATATNQLAVGQTGLVLRRNGEGHWERVATDTDQRLMAVDVADDGVAVAVGSFGAMLRSPDGGRSWAAVTNDWEAMVEDGFEPHLYGVQAWPGGVFCVVGEYGLILRSDDHGKTWTKVNGGEASLFAVQIAEDGDGYAVGQTGTVLRTRDAGQSWTPIKVPSDANLLGVSQTASGEVVIPGMRDMLVSQDDGASWQQVSDEDISRIWYLGAAAARGNKVIVVGQTERIASIGPGG